MFRMKLASDGSGRETLLTLDLITAHSMYVDTAKEQVELRILMDAYSIEVFADGGRNV